MLDKEDKLSSKVYITDSRVPRTSASIYIPSKLHEFIKILSDEFGEKALAR